MPASVDKPVTKQPEKAIYFIRPLRLQLANWIPEKRVGGRIDSPEQPLTLQGHIYTTTDPKEIRFIEGTHSFKSNQIVRCQTIQEARIHAAALMESKGIRNRYVDATSGELPPGTQRGDVNMADVAALADKV